MYSSTCVKIACIFYSWNCEQHTLDEEYFKPSNLLSKMRIRDKTQIYCTLKITVGKLTFYELQIDTVKKAPFLISVPHNTDYGIEKELISFDDEVRSLIRSLLP